MGLKTKELDYDLSGGASNFEAENAVKADSDKCTIEVVGTSMVGVAALQVSAAGENFTNIDDFSLILTGGSVSIPVTGITPGSYLRLIVSSGSSGTLTKVHYLFG